MKTRTWVQVCSLSLIALTVSALPVIFTDTDNGPFSQKNSFSLKTTKGTVVAGQTGWSEGTTSTSGLIYSTTEVAPLTSMFITNTIPNNAVINSVILDLSPVLNANAPSFTPTTTTTFTPTFGVTNTIYGIITIGTFSQVIDPAALNVNLSGAISQILTGAQFQIDWYMRTIFSSNVTGAPATLNTTVWNALTSGTFTNTATITVDVDQNNIEGVPEPGTMALLGGALLGLAWYRRRRG